MTATSTPPGSKRRERHRFRRPIARRGLHGSAQQGAPTQRARPQTRRHRRSGTPGLGPAPPVVSQTQGAHVMRLRSLHDLDKRLVERAAPQRDEHAFGGVEDPRPRTARILRPARHVQLALTSLHQLYPNAHHITCGNNNIFLNVLGRLERDRDPAGSLPCGQTRLEVSASVDAQNALYRGVVLVADHLPQASPNGGEVAFCCA
jgi:hypothetical protein